MHTSYTNKIAALGLVVGLAGCNVVLGLSDFGEQPSGGGGAGAGTTSSGSGGQASTSSGAGTGPASSGAGGQAASSSGAGGQPSSSSGGGGQAPICNPSTHACVPALPAGWVGPTALYLGDSGESAPGCAGTYPDDAGAFVTDLQAETPTCDCSCGPATGIVCGTTASVCSRSSCGVTFCNGTKTSVGACGSYSIPGPSVDVTPPSPSNVGTCTAQASNTIKPATWAVAARACGGATATSEGCDDGGACTPLALAPFDKMCAQHAGDVDCPDAFYTEKHVLYDGATDTRSCSACSCGQADSSCGGSLNFVSACSGTPTLYSSIQGGFCGAMNTGYVSYSPSPSGTCTPQGGALEGTLTPKGAVTFCCQP